MALLKYRSLTSWVPVLVWMALIFYFSSRSQPPIELPTMQLLASKTAHVIEYGVLAGLFFRAIRRIWDQERYATPDAPVDRPGVAGRVLPIVLGSFAATIAYASTDEFHQAFVAGRHPLVTDVGIDSLGAAAFLLVILAISYRRML